MSGDHGAVFIDMVGTVEVDRIVGQVEGGPGTNNVRSWECSRLYSRFDKTT